MLTQAPKSKDGLSINWRDSAESIIAMGRYLKEIRDSLPQDEYASKVRLMIGIDVSAAKKLIKLAEHPIISNPLNFDRLPQRWALLTEAMYLPRDVLLRAISNGALIDATKYDIWKLYDKKTLTGARVAVPKGMSLEELCRSGMAMEKGGLPAEGVAKKIGIGAHTYRMIRSVIMLTENKTLSDHDKAIAEAALKEMNRTKNVRRYYKNVKPIIDKMWGESRNMSFSKIEQKRIDNFRKAVIIICDTCVQGGEMEVPPLPDKVRTEAYNKLTKTREAISKLRGKIRKAND